MGGNATFNLASAYGVGLLEFSFGKDGISSRLGMGGTNVSFQNLRNVAAGYKEASKVTDWKYGNTETSSTLNSINMLGYTTLGMNQQLAKDIWSEKLAVEYGNTGVGSGAHLHFSLFTRNNEFSSDSTMRILLGKSYNTSDNTLDSSVKYWEKEFWNSQNLYSWGSYRTAYNPELYWLNKLNTKLKIQGE